MQFASHHLRPNRLATAAALLGLLGTSIAAATPPTPAAKPASAARRPGAPAVDRLFPRPAQLTHVKHLVLDPGHGGDNLGALGFHATQEKALTLEVSKFIAAFIQRHSNIRVTLTRTEDRPVALRARPRQANALGADALISLHCNASPDPAINGMEVWFLEANAAVNVVHELVRREEGLPETGAAAELAWSVDGILSDMRHAAAHGRSQMLALSLAKGLRRARPKAAFRGVRQAPFGVLKEALMAAVVLEIGYITHAKESLALLEHQAQLELARGVLLGLVEMDRLVAQQERGRRPAAHSPPRAGKGPLPARAGIQPAPAPRPAASK